jgi:iron-sulfur cluster repair protein YtfE (RIC family)
MIDRFTLDMTMMYAVHDAFRRDLAHVAQMTARSEGWEVFERFLRAHHEAEDEALWPVLRKALVDRTDDLALLDDMEAEHAALEPLLAALDDALVRGKSGPTARAELAARLQEHLTHEEEAALPVIDRTLDTAQWMQFGDSAAARIGRHMPTFLPWLLDGADGERAEAILGVLPEPAQQDYRNEWVPAYAARSWWAT